jgi:energy-coupling factor transporter ATP-binding protein EcfA2
MAKNIAEEICNLDTSEGYVVAIMGPWGSGKTSLVNLIKSSLNADAPHIEILDFNPWMFSGAEQLIHTFFAELAAQLRLKRGRFEKLADDFDTYGDLLSPLTAIPLLGAWLDRVRGAGKALKKFKDSHKESATARRAVLASKLSEIEQPIVVIIDDIDRLNTAEIQDMFKLVRLTANFPNVVYLLAFDRRRVEDALGKQGVDGRSFLEKIVQHAIDIPSIPEQVMYRQISEALGNALNSVSDDISLDTARWYDIFPEIVRPLVRNMRDVRRYADAARETTRALLGRVELADLLALEAIRVFMPDTFGLISQSKDALTVPAPPIGGRNYAEAESKAAIDALVECAGSQREVLVQLIDRVFPAAGRHVGRANYSADWQKTWLKTRRVAHPDILRMYLERIANEGVLAFEDAEHAFSILNNQAALDAFLRSINVDRQTDVIAALEVYEGDYPTEAIVPAMVVLLNFLPDLPEPKTRTMISMSTRLIVIRVVLKLLRQLASPEAVKSAVDQAWNSIHTIYGRMTLTTIIGNIEDAGHELVDKQVAIEYAERVDQMIDSTAPSDLAQEKNVRQILYWKRRRDKEVSITLNGDQLDSVPFVRALLMDSVHDVRSQGLGNRAIHVQRRIHWDSFVEFFGDESTLARVLEKIRESYEDKETIDALELVEKYLSGWRPERFD